MSSISYIGIGSNIGNRLKYMQNGVEKLSALAGNNILAISSVYETKPYGPVEQDNFLNCVVKLEHDSSLREMLTDISTIEKELGRNRLVKWGSRTIDLDILINDTFILDDIDLVVPHPELTKRDFVLVPLLEIDADISHPVSGKKLYDYFTQLKDKCILSKTDYSLSLSGGTIV